MVGWVTQVRDTEFLGYGPYVECTHCHNKGWLDVLQPYFQQWAYSVIPTPKSYGDFVVRCRVCQWGSTIKKKDLEKVQNVLEQGKSATKETFDKMSDKNRQRILKNLNRNRLHDLARYLSFDATGG